jgi:hypothetical protein
MVTVGVVVHPVLRHRVDIDEASRESLLGYGVSVNIGGVFGRRGPPWRRCVGMLPAFVCVFRVETFLRLFGGVINGGMSGGVVLRWRSDDGGMSGGVVLRCFLLLFVSSR